MISVDAATRRRNQPLLPFDDNAGDQRKKRRTMQHQHETAPTIYGDVLGILQELHVVAESPCNDTRSNCWTRCCRRIKGKK